MSDPTGTPDWERVKAVFEEARQLPAGARARFLAETCGDDLELLQEVASLLKSDQAAQSGLDAMEGALSSALASTVGFPRQIGPYTLSRLLGAGGMGEVWLGEQLEPVRRQVAVKIIKLGMDTKQVVARFEAERQALAVMDHPNIATVYDGGVTADGRPYFVMELVQGEPLTHYCDTNKLSVRERLRLFIDVCRAVQHAHQKGVLHRDLKPSNLLVTAQNGAPIVKVIDFGISKTLGVGSEDSTALTQPGIAVGTPEYMSPEQADPSNSDVDTRTDVYSLGVVLYELLMGAKPFDFKLVAGVALARALMELEVPRPSAKLARSGTEETVAEHRSTTTRELRRNLENDLDWVILKAMAMERDQRYATVDGLAEDLENFLHNEPVLARPPSATYRLRRFVRRNRVGVIGAAAVLVALVAGSVTTSVGFLRAQEAARVATSRAVAAEANSVVEEDPELSLLLGLRAAELAPTPEAADALRRALKSRWLTTLDTLDIWDVEFSPDGRWVAMTRSDSTARVWAAETLTGTAVLTGHRSPLRGGLAFSPDGRWLATADGEGVVKIWNTETWAERLSFAGHGGSRLAAIAFSPDGRRLATGGGDGTARLWDAETGSELLSIAVPGGGLVMEVAFSPDGRRLATTNATQAAQVWDSESGSGVLSLPHDEGSVYGVAFSPDGNRMASSSALGTAKIWDARTGAELFELTGHDSGATRVAFSPDGRLVATVSPDRTARVWDATTGLELFSLKGHRWGLVQLAFSPDSRRLATVSSADEAMVWDVVDGEALFTLSRPGSREFQLAYMSGGLNNTFFGVRFSPDGRWVAAATGGESAKVWDTRNGSELVTLTGHGGPVHGIAFSPDGLRLATASQDSTVKVWNAETGGEVLTLAGHVGEVVGVVFSPDGTRLASASNDGTAKIWNAATGAEVLTLSGHALLGMSLVRLGGGPPVPYLEVETSEAEGDIVVSRTFGVNEVAFSPDGRRLATAGVDGTARVWDAETGAELTTVAAHQVSITGLAFSPDGRTIATTGPDGTVRLWDAATGAGSLELHAPLQGPIGLSFSQDGRQLSAGSMVGQMKTWDLETGLEVRTISVDLGTRNHRRLRGWSISPDGRLLATNSVDGMVKVFPYSADAVVSLASGRVRRDLTETECRVHLHLERCPER